MSSLDIHIKKYQLFRKDAFNERNSPMTRIESLFEASFHLIEACCALHRLHINKHQLVRKLLEENVALFQENSPEVWRKFQDLENQIRPGQLYGGKINGERLKESQAIFSFIEALCVPILRKEEYL
ncbi:MAG: hypothetical protein AB1668_01135 [Nanoarchaeota archaeon]